MFGCPEEIMSDNGPQYAGETFKKFCREWQINHVTSSPNYAQSNGFIERHVKHVKSLIKKAIKSGDDLSQVMLNIRATPIDPKLKSPAQLLFGRPINTLLPHRSEPGQESEREQHWKRQEEAEKNFPQRTELPPFHVGQNVRILDTRSNNKTWSPAKVIQKKDQRSYIVETPIGRKLRRNRLHMRESTSNQPPRQPNVLKHTLQDPQMTVPKETPNEIQPSPKKQQASKEIIKIPVPTKVNDKSKESETPASKATVTVTRSGRVSKPNPKYCKHA